MTSKNPNIEILNSIRDGKPIKHHLKSILFKLKFLKEEVIPSFNRHLIKEYFFNQLRDEFESRKLPPTSITKGNLYKFVISDGVNIAEVGLTPHPELNELFEEVVSTFRQFSINKLNEQIEIALNNPAQFQLLQPNFSINSNYILHHLEDNLETYGDVEDVSSAFSKILKYFCDVLGTKIYGFTTTFKLLFGTEHPHITKFKRLSDCISIAIDMYFSNTKLQSPQVVRKKLEYSIESLNRNSCSDIVAIASKIIDNAMSSQIKLTKSYFYSELFGFYIPSGSYGLSTLKQLNCLSQIESVFESACISKHKNINTWNRENMNMLLDSWKIYFLNDLSVHSLLIDFTAIKSKVLRQEIKEFLLKEHSLKIPYRTYRVFSELSRAFDFVNDQNEIHCIEDFDLTTANIMLSHLKHNSCYKLPSIKKTLSALRALYDFVSKKYPLESRSYNVFRQVTIISPKVSPLIDDYIPEEVISKLSNHYTDLQENYQLMYEILINTGMRAKEVFHLEIGCTNYDDFNEEYAEISFVPFKTLNARKKKNLSKYYKLFLTKDLHDKIQNYEYKNRAIYEKYNTNYLFIRVNKNNKGTFLVKSAQFCLAINKLIKKHDIRTTNGRLWHFTSKQCRKSMAYELINNGATITQVKHQLGHITSETTQKYYLNVNIHKLADINAEFLEQEFKLFIQKEQLKSYTEDERKELYYDLQSKTRVVEFGRCLKHPSEGHCGERIKTANCSICAKLCTGISYLPKWLNLLNSEIQLMNELKELYQKKEIENYEDFIEYKQCTSLIKRYQSVIDELKEKEKEIIYVSNS